MRLSELARELGLPAYGQDVDVAGVSSDSRRVAPGDLFVAIPGRRHDGARFVADALAAGAVAVCATHPQAGVPTLVAPDPRAILGRAAAAVYDHPARRVRVIGVTGTLGKTSTALTLARCLTRGAAPAGVIGSLGIEIPGVDDWKTELTTPEAPVIQKALSVMDRHGIPHAVMEVSSHSLLLGRVDGVELAVGVFLNLVPNEHLEFHPTPEHYLETKLRFLDLLRPDAPLVHNGDDARTRDAIARDAERRPQAPRIGVSSHDDPGAAVWVSVDPLGLRGSRLTLNLRRSLPRLDGGTVLPQRLELDYPLLGLQLAWNATVAATAALVAGVSPEALSGAFATLPPISRRMEIVHAANPLILDDTAGNPRSIRAVLETVLTLPYERVRVAYVVRGARGTTINRDNGAAIADLVRRLDAELVVSTSSDHADERNRVAPAELDAVLNALRSAGTPHLVEPSLEAAVSRVMEGAGAGDVILLLGAQGMDAGAGVARSLLGLTIASGEGPADLRRPSPRPPSRLGASHGTPPGD